MTVASTKIGRSVVDHAVKKSSVVRMRLWPGAVVAFVLGLASSSAQAQDQHYNFRSVLSPPGAGFCVDIRGSRYQSGTALNLASCTAAPNQTFGYPERQTLTVCGYCVDGLSQRPSEPPGEGDPVVISECTDQDSQVWELRPFKSNPSVFAIANPDNLCVTANAGTLTAGTPLVLSACQELDRQGWVPAEAGPPVCGGYSEPTYYFRGGRRHCWYDEGWSGAGWYWCGENLNQGIGWGGSIPWWVPPPGPTIRPTFRPTIRPTVSD